MIKLVELEKKIHIIGIGMGNVDTLTVKAHEYIKNADCIIGAKRVVENIKTVAHQDNENVVVVNEYLPSKVLAFIRENPQFKKIVIAFSGDTGFFSGTKKLVTQLEVLSDYEIDVLAGISSVSYFSSKIYLSWDDMKIISLHGKDDNFIDTIKTNNKTFMLTGGDWVVKNIVEKMISYGFGDCMVYVGERLSYADEKITTATANQLQGIDFDVLSVMVVVNENAQKLMSFGIDDEQFIRGDVPMTKSEIRTVSLSKMKIKDTDVLYDVGAGTGSVAIEMALMASKGKVYAIERFEKATKLIAENKLKFKADNLEIIEGLAPTALEDLESPDAVFIGGSSGNLNEIIDLVLAKNPKARICINAIALETLSQSMEIFKDGRFTDIDVTQLSTGKGRSVGKYTMMSGLNPIFIITAVGKGE